MKNKYFCLLALGVAGSMRAQAQRLSGRVLDAATGQSVPYVSLSVPGTNQGTTSNAEGEFELALKLPARLIVSELSHRADTLALTAGQTTLTVRLQPAATALPDVVPGAYTTELLRKAYRHLHHTNRLTYSQAFYRQITRLNNEPTEVQEMVWYNKADGLGVQETAAFQGRYAKKKALISFKDFSLFTRGIVITDLTDSTVSRQPMSLDPAAVATLNLLGISSDGNRQLAEIGFKDKTSPDEVYGSILIDTDTHQLLRYRMTTTAIGMKFTHPLFETTKPSTTMEWVFRPLADGTTVLSHYKINCRFGLKRPLKPDMPVDVAAFTVFYDDQAAPTPGVIYKAAKRSKTTDLEAIKALPYDPAFWQNNSMVKRTPLEEATIKSFEQKGAFGTLLTP